jgi:hypothetical protein
LLDNVTFPEAAPAAVGVNVTLTVQDAPAGIEAPQVLVDANGRWPRRRTRSRPRRRCWLP